MAVDLWSDSELRIALSAYLQQKSAVEAGARHSPTQFHRSLSGGALAPRSEGSVGRRMSNISWVLQSSGLPYFGLYTPSLTQAGAGVKKRLLAIYEELASQPAGDVATFEALVDVLMQQPAGEPPVGTGKPRSVATLVQRIERSAAVAAWVLHNAKGKCEACLEPAPFQRKSGGPYLEVHHLDRLADGGPDTIYNAVAVCPNCHRRLHLGADADALSDAIRSRMQRPPPKEMIAGAMAVSIFQAGPD